MNPEPSEDFYTTCTAVNTIVEHRLYKNEASSIDKYVKKYQNVSRATFYNISDCGAILLKLRAQGVPSDELPSNAALCLGLAKLQKKLGIALKEIWEKNVEYYAGRQNVIACRLNAPFKGQDSEVDDQASPTAASIPEVIPEDEDEDEEEDDEDEDGIERVGMQKLSKWRHCIGNSTSKGENEYNCPPVLCTLIDDFVKTFHDSIDLDVCSNPCSNIICKHFYGIQHDGSFVDAFELPRWCIPATEEERLLPPSLWTGTPKVVICNPPARPLDEEQAKFLKKNEFMSPTFVKLLVQMVENGDCEHALLLLPMDWRRTWTPPLIERANQVAVFYKYDNQMSEAARRRDPSRRPVIADPNQRCLVYLSHEPDTEIEKSFCEIFSEVAYLPKDVREKASHNLRKRNRQNYAETVEEEEDEAPAKRSPVKKQDRVHKAVRDFASANGITYIEGEDFLDTARAELQSGNAARVIGLVSECSAELHSKAMLCFVEKQKSTIAYLDSESGYPLARKFIDAFQKHGFIPGVNSFSVTSSLLDVEKKAPLRYFSAFAGIGGAEVAMNRVFENAECVGYSETDPSAIKIYQMHHCRQKNFGDIDKIDLNRLPSFDLLIGGSPCQPFSKANKFREGFLDVRAGPFQGYIRLLEAARPRYFLFENVIMADESRDEITKALGVQPVLLNSADFSAQHRKRLYWANFRIPQAPYAVTPKIEDIIDVTVKSPSLKNGTFLDGVKPLTDKICSICLSGDRKISFRTDGKSNTIVASLCYPTIVNVNGRFRQLTLLEKERLQGFPDNYTRGVSETDRRRIIANAFQVDTLCHILKHL